MTRKTKIPVILDTDIGSDIDDTWALAMLLKSPELDLKLAVACHANTSYRARLIARLLEIAGRSDIPVGIGLQQESNPGIEKQMEWVTNHQLENYRGQIHADGVQALIDAILQACEPVTLIAIGPLSNIAEALRREPRIAPLTRFVGMHGALFQGYAEQGGPVAEYNVIQDVAAAQAVFAAPWREKIITPLDTCARVCLQGEKYQAVCRSSDPLIQAVMENYRIWLQGRADEGRSSILYDTVAVYLAFAEQLLKIEELGVRVTDDGFTWVDPQGYPWRAALAWHSLSDFEDFLVQRLIG